MNLFLLVYVVALFIVVLAVTHFARERRERDADKMIDLLEWFEEFGLGAFFHVIVLFGVLSMMYVGWRVPFELAQIAEPFGEQPPDNSGLALLPSINEFVFARAAQIIGALSFGYVALRMMRFILPIIACLLLALLLILLWQYVLGSGAG